MEKFKQDIITLANRSQTIKDKLLTEESTKTSLIMPFFQTLGYDVFNPSEFVPEFVSDIGIKKGEKIDYAIMADNQPIILIEAKSVNDTLTTHGSQLFRYFHTSSAKFAILTNGIIYQFFTDLDAPNKMDEKPFFTFNLEKIKDSSLTELIKFRKDSFDLESIFITASDLKYLNIFKEYFEEEYQNVSDDLVKYFVSKIYDGKATKNILDKFNPIINKGIKQFVSEKVSSKINEALKTTDEIASPKSDIEITELLAVETESKANNIETTEEEIQGYGIIKAILFDTVDPERVYYRDNQSYFNILIDNSIRKWVVRLNFNKNRKFLVFNDDNSEKVYIENEADILQFSDRLIAICNTHITI